MNYGAKYFRWAKMTSDDSKEAMPVYGEAGDIGGINEVDETLNFAEAAAYADNEKKLQVNEFSDGTLATQVLYQEVDLKGELLGCKIGSDGALIYGGEDNQPFGGAGFYHNMMDAAKNKYYEVIYYPKVQAYIEGKNHATKSDSINLEYEPVNFYVFQPECGKYKIEKRFNTESEAQTYLDGLFTGDSEVDLSEDEASPTSIQPMNVTAEATGTTTTKATTTKSKK